MTPLSETGNSKRFNVSALEFKSAETTRFLLVVIRIDKAKGLLGLSGPYPGEPSRVRPCSPSRFKVLNSDKYNVTGPYFVS